MTATSDEAGRPTQVTFGIRLRERVSQRGPLCVGIDPHPSLLEAWGLADDARGLDAFASTVIEALAGQVAVLKPQSAFFERHGSSGITVLERTAAAARAGGALVLLDAKRGDIGSTMAAYADYLDPGHPLAVDAMTVSPYLGFGSLAPAVSAAKAYGGGLFVLARTSNPEGGEVQLAGSSTGSSVAQQVIDAVGALNADSRPDGSVGVVIGATLQRLDVDISMLGGPVLCPGLGAQGGDPVHLRRLFGGYEGVLLPSSSREILRHGPDLDALRSAAAAMAEALGPIV
ncbi:MAG: orotidine-5'-phosphate decarboxylase [Geodermatophilaceae bacterium]|nr:orotidine-5'-phosphate decarboxylase [Geodermatophilaceae bacterium]